MDAKDQPAPAIVLMPWTRRAFLWIHLPLLIVFVSFFVLDQASKHHAQETLLLWQDPHDTDMYRGRQIPLLALGEDVIAPADGLPLYFGFGLQYSRNKGAAFSMLSNLDDSIRVPFFHGVTVLAVFLIAYYYRNTPVDHHLTRYGLAMILSGAIGNFADRMQHGYVIDYFDADWNFFGWRHDFAIFNVADVAINIGVFCFLLDMLLVTLRERRQKRAASAV